jgi:ubiquitin-like protein 5
VVRTAAFSLLRLLRARVAHARRARRYNVYKDHITLEDYEIHDGMGLELYYN